MVTWIVVADGGRAEVRRQRSPGGAYELVEAIECPQCLIEAQSVEGARGFAKEIARRLAAARLARRFDALIIAAEPGFLELIRDALDLSTRQRVRSYLEREMLGSTQPELASQLASSPAHGTP